MEINETLTCGINHLLVQKSSWAMMEIMCIFLARFLIYYVFENQVVALIKSCSFKVLNHWNTNVVFSIC